MGPPCPWLDSVSKALGSSTPTLDPPLPEIVRPHCASFIPADLSPHGFLSLRPALYPDTEPDTSTFPKENPIKPNILQASKSDRDS